LPVLNDEDYQWLRPGREASCGDQIRDKVAWVMTVGRSNRITGRLSMMPGIVPPPDAHMLDRTRLG
jgi:hypothetical protein